MIESCLFADRCNKIDCDKDFCVKKFKLDYLFDQALLSEKHKKELVLRVDADKRDLEAFKYLKSIQNSVEKFVENGDNLYIHSLISGNGKTSFAIKILKEYFYRIWSKSDLRCRGLYIHVPKYLISLKDNISEKSDYVQHIKKNALDADLVIFDEVGTKSLTSFEFENILTIINARLDYGKANIYTSNLTNEELLDNLGSRLYSRIVNNSNDVVFVGQDKRGLFQ